MNLCPHAIAKCELCEEEAERKERRRHEEKQKLIAEIEEQIIRLHMLEDRVRSLE